MTKLKFAAIALASSAFALMAACQDLPSTDGNDTVAQSEAAAASEATVTVADAKAEMARALSAAAATQGPGSPAMWTCLLYTSPSPRDQRGSRMPSSA